jgi:hypothetical protein
VDHWRNFVRPRNFPHPLCAAPAILHAALAGSIDHARGAATFGEAARAFASKTGNRQPNCRPANPLTEAAAGK